MNPEELYTQALSEKDKGDYGNAFNNLNQLVMMDPNCAKYRLALSVVCNKLAQPTEHFRDLACFHAEQLVHIEPDVARNWTALGEMSLLCHKYYEAVAAYEKSVSLDPTDAKVWTILGFAFTRMGREADVIRCYEEALRLDPELGDVHFLMSTMYVGQTYNPKAQAHHAERAFTCDNPTRHAVDACWNAALGYLGAGNYVKGWNYFESRLRGITALKGTVLPQQRYNIPLWVKEQNVRVLVQHEMGFGDAFTFARFLPIFKEKYNLEVTFEAMPEMYELMRHSLGPDIKVIKWGAGNADTYDFTLPMMSLPLACEIDENTVLFDKPYIKAESWKVAEWDVKEFANRPHAPLKLGICWAGGSRAYNAMNYATDGKRSLTFDQIQPLLSIPNVEFVSLQYGSTDFAPPEGIKSFSDTAALIELLDGVVTVDTAIANLAGAMGKTVWLLNRYDTCWRWSEELKHPWYPTVEDVRQKVNGDWQPVLDDVNDALIRLTMHERAA